ncbi:MAG: GNAT family N-acetyltransferase [Akkermansiaceae bacterium]
MITTRRAEKNDGLLFRDIRLRAVKDSPEAFGSTLESMVNRDFNSWKEQIESTVSSTNRNTQFAFDGKRCIGVAALYREEGTETGGLIMMWVSPEYRGTGVAGIVVCNLLAWAKEVGMSDVYLDVTASNTRARRFYENCGFVSTGEDVDCDPARNLKAIRMSKKLR